MTVYGCARPHPHEIVCGDAWLAIPTEIGLRVALVDGAGHGSEAAAAASLALESLRRSANRELRLAIAECHGVLRGSRGAVISVVDVLPASLTFAGVGNVEAKLITLEREQRFIPDRGLAGAAIPTIRPITIELPSTDWLFYLYSDGISSKVHLDLLSSTDPQRSIDDAVSTWGRPTDDATIVLILP